MDGKFAVLMTCLLFQCLLALGVVNAQEEKNGALGKYENRPKANEVEFLDSDESSRDDLEIKAEIEKDQDKYYAELDKKQHSFDEVKDLAASKQRQENKQEPPAGSDTVEDGVDVDRMLASQQQRAQALSGNPALGKVTQEDVAKIGNSGQLQAVLQQFGIGGAANEQQVAQQEFAKKLLTEKGALEALLRQMVAPFQGMSDEQARGVIVESMKNSRAQGFFDYFPWLYSLFGRLLKDPDAFPKLGGIIADRNRLYWFIGLTFVTFVVSFLIKRKIKRIDERKFFSRKRFKYLLLLSLAFWSTRIYLLVHFFGKELAPAWAILVDTAPYLSFLK